MSTDVSEKHIVYVFDIEHAEEYSSLKEGLNPKRLFTLEGLHGPFILSLVCRSHLRFFIRELATVYSRSELPACLLRHRDAVPNRNLFYAEDVMNVMAGILCGICYKLQHRPSQRSL
jgi:hypothetical protein